MRKIILYVVILFQIALIVSLVRGIQLSRRASLRIASMEEAKAKLIAEQEKLKQEEEYVQSPYYLEKVARDELHLSKPGETVVIVPEGQLTDQGPADAKAMAGEGEKANWRKWWEVLSGNW